MNRKESPAVSTGSAVSDQADALRAELAVTRREVEDLREALRAARVRERLLAGEVQHRVRNMLAVIRSIFRRTRESGASNDEFAEHFEGRLDAVARYEAGAGGPGSPETELEDILRNELLQAHCLDGPNCVLSGPPVYLRHRSVELMGLAVHELATNSIKFGALFHGGRLSVEWSLSGSAERPELHLRWIETGVPLVAPTPRARGFGQQLIEEALPYQLGATTSFTLKPGGLECTIRLPLAGAAPDRDLADDLVADERPLLPSEVE